MFQVHGGQERNSFNRVFKDAEMMMYTKECACVHAQWLQACLTLCNRLNSRLSGSSVHGILPE